MIIYFCHFHQEGVITEVSEIEVGIVFNTVQHCNGTLCTLKYGFTVLI